jgi:hypothetical protein
MNFHEAQFVAAFANSHEGGVPQPRADVVETFPGFYAVDIRSLSVIFNGSTRRTEIESERVYNRTGAARVLGY